MIKRYIPLIRHSLAPPLKLLFSSSAPEAPKKLTVFYDASCSVCDWEINHYKALQYNHPNLERIDFQDISSDNHVLLAQRNITQEQALDYFHGITANRTHCHSEAFNL
jgi:predicted DCC family thiol-disulfide oxidoreductase YuxK